MKKTTRSTCLAMALLSVLAQTAFAALPDVLRQPAVHSNVSAQAVLLDVARAGDRLVAVGERGIIRLSDDNGNTWHQARVPVSATLTAVQFVSANSGWAVGHSGVVLHTRDGGENWSVQFDGIKAAEMELVAAERSGDPRQINNAQQLVTDGADKPWLALHFVNEREGLVAGAYGLTFHTEDGGQTWQSWTGRIPNSRGMHAYAVTRIGDTIYLAGEQGLFVRSRDGGKQFERLETPYEGSFFSLLAASEQHLLLAGLRGRLFVSEDGGTSFTEQDNPLPVSVNTVRQLGKRLAIVNQAGVVILAAGIGQPLQVLPPGPGGPSTSIIEAADGALVTVGFGGAQRLPRSTQ